MLALSAGCVRPRCAAALVRLPSLIAAPRWRRRRKPMLMTRQPDMSVQVLYNRCPHRGVQVVGNLKGNTGSAFVCSYHAWSFHLDGSVRAIPLAKGYEGTRMTKDNPDCGMKRAARVDSYRGFVFASLAADGPPLLEFLGDAKVA